MKKAILIIVLFLSFVNVADAQKTAYPEKLSITFSFPEQKINDTNAVLLRVHYKNNESVTLPVFKELVDGSWQSPYANLYVKIQILKNGKYENIIDKSYDYLYGDSIVVFPHHMLLPGKSFETNFNLFDKMPFFAKGKYRLSIYLLKIPLDENKPYVMEYINSKWFYFEITKALLRY